MPRSFLVKKVKHPVDHSNRWPYHEPTEAATPPPGFTIHYTNDKKLTSFKHWTPDCFLTVREAKLIPFCLAETKKGQLEGNDYGHLKMEQCIVLSRKAVTENSKI
ncbi:uncharacterized protein LOC118192976 [Stegodyphus dumicola]|uniref:uncharacterized protein LOC118192976 n=1 Tax=Stegodyphus dumicola TaxID=202533 RepID=UPI0015AAD119|nr:uncharacterized protein LOC118192976 [Stegodyphus dumicola]